MNINERLRRLEKAFGPQLKAPEFKIYFVGSTNIDSTKTTADLILSADGTRWVNPTDLWTEPVIRG